MKPLVTVIVPVYNHERYIGECLDSIAGQNYHNIEVIIINDGSTDSSALVIERWLHHNADISVKYINKKNEGLCNTLNVALSLAQGEYIAFIASDDVWLPTRLERQVAFLEDNKNIGLVFADAYFIKGYDKTTVKYSHYKPDIPRRYLNCIQNANIYESLLVSNSILSLTVLVRRECVTNVGSFDPTLKYEDYDMWLRIARRYPVAYIDDPLAYYRIHESNFSNDSIVMLIGAIQSIRKQHRDVSFPFGRFKRTILFVGFLFFALKNRFSRKRLLS